MTSLSNPRAAFLRYLQLVWYHSIHHPHSSLLSRPSHTAILQYTTIIHNHRKPNNRMTVTQRMLPLLQYRRPATSLTSMRTRRRPTISSSRLLLLLASSSSQARSVSSLATPTATARIPIWYDSTNHLHRDFASYHPEQPQRITA